MGQGKFRGRGKQNLHAKKGKSLFSDCSKLEVHISLVIRGTLKIRDLTWEIPMCRRV